MDEIKIWTIEGSQVSPVQQTNRMDSERHLEEILVENPKLLMPGLTLVGRQTQTEGGPLDLLGVDSDGRLVVFELKRGTLSRDAVAQIIDYVSYLEDMDLDALVNHISDKSGAHGIDKIDDFEKWYIENENLEVDSLDSLRPLRMFLVGLGVDDTTERMVNFLAKNGMDISLLTFYGFEQDGKVLLARQMRVEGDDDDSRQVRRTRRSQEEFRELLDSRKRKYSVSDLFDTVIKMFRKNWPNSLERSNKHGLNFRLQKRSNTGRLTRVNHARIDPEEKMVRVVFFRSAIRLCVDEFKPLIKEIPFKTHPPNREDDALKDLDAALENDLEIQFQLTAADWDVHKDKLNRLTRAVYKAQQSTLQGN